MKTNIGLLSIGQTLFNLGIVFLISAPFIASIFLIFSLLISFSLKGTTLLNNKWNYPIFTCFGIAIISTLKNTNFSDQTLVANIYKSSKLDPIIINFCWNKSIYFK